MLGVDGGVSLSDPVHFPSSRRLHKWGGEHLGALAAPPLYPRPRAFEGPRTQRSISLVFPLCSQPDEVISPPSVWPRAVPNSRVLKYLGGAADDSPRLGPYDRTATQPAQDIERGTSYNLDYCRPAAMRTITLPPLGKRVSAHQEQTAALKMGAHLPLSAVDDDVRSAQDIHRAARFGLMAPRASASQFVGTGKAALDAPYDPSRHGERSIMPPRGHVFIR